ncbi:DUF551 domain-containing protein [Escherichia coli]|uniref:DUF551 domain-containing protein n=1 Tax=Escherichia coli TaxID=562 RepID=UPI001482FE48|nr:DUF551 domain-containing protein [Escherichia coli]NNQ41515.1 DUF551 domain-containing protein [Escherichia coli]
MTTITDKKQYPSEQYLNELITNIEFAARAPVEVVRAMAAELQKRREADSAEPVSQTYKLTFEQWLERQHGKIDVDCGCVSTETLLHWMRVAYEAGNSPVIPDGWINCSERMPEKNQNVLISVNFDSSLVEPLICSARYTGITFRRGDVTIKPGNGIEQATHWMPLPEPPQESKSE